MKRLLQSKNTPWSRHFSLLLLSFCFLFILLRIEPKLFYQSQEPVFFFDRHFVTDFFLYPGGCNELMSRFLSQFFYYSWTGALLLVAIFALIVHATRRFVESVGHRPIFYLHWLPAILLLALHSDYRFPLVFTLATGWILLGINLYVCSAPAKSWRRFLFYLALFSLLYYIIAAQAFVFALTIALYETLHHRRILLPSLYIICAALLPFIGASAVFIMSLQDAYASQLASFATYKVTWLSWALAAFFPLALLLTTLAARCTTIAEEKNSGLARKLCHLRSDRMRWMHGVILFFCMLYVSLYAYKKNENIKALLLVDYYARRGEWESVIEMVKKNPLSTDYTLYQADRALYHCGRLCDDLFSLPQYLGGKGLFLHGKLHYHFPLQHSDLFFDLGLLNESEHWAYEALVVKGDTPWNLQRLALVNILENNSGVAERYLDMLQKTMWHRAWATDHRQYLLDSGDLLSSPHYHYLQSAVPAADFLVSPIEPERCLEELLKTSRNKMAYEYFMSYCLLDGKISPFMKHLYLLNSFGYTEMPHHFEEALLIYLQMTGGDSSSLPKVKVSTETTRKFADFNQILEKYDKNKKRAYNELREKYGDTYWFYALYYYKEQ
ncbi:hypothetical protein JW998_00875 [candidate division KSB1 bacterium]|nr:hypothetical protein [candidate division KSB1 bacterium]